MPCALHCVCHRFYPWQVASASIEVIEAATACPSCRHVHCGVFLVSRSWDPYDAPKEPPAPFQFVAPDDDGN